MDSSVVKSVALVHLRGAYHLFSAGDSFNVTVVYVHWHGEELLIEGYKRVCDGGTLLNMSTGGPRSARGVPMSFSPEHRAKIGAASRGRKASAETRAKLSAARKGKKQSPEFIAKRIAATVAAKRAKRAAMAA